IVTRAPLFSLCALVAFATPAAATDTLPLAFAKDVTLPGDASRFDYVSIDPTRGLLFMAHLGASEVLAFDTAHERVAGRIAKISHVHGVLAIPERGRIYATATGTDEVVAIDADALKIVARIAVGAYPDG